MKVTVFKIALFVSLTLYGQNIPLKGNLGVQLTPAPENQYGGVYAIGGVSPNSTAENLGLQPNDILLEVNGEKLDSNQKIEKVIGKFVANEKATALVFRNNKTVRLKGKIMPKPQFNKPEHELDLLEVPFRQGYVRAYLNRPKGDGPFPTIFYIQGYPCQSINSHPKSPTQQLTNGLVDLGYAVFRIEKPGVGEFSNLQSCSNYSFDDEVENFANGLKLLKTLPHVDSSQVYLFGHSLGGNVAPLIAKTSETAGIMVYGTLVKSWEDYLLDMAHYSQSFMEDSPGLMEKIPVLKSVLDKLYVQDLTHDSLTENEKALIADWHDYKPDGTIFNRDIDFWKNFNAHDYVKAWSEIDVPILAMHGESDAHAISSLDAELIANTVNQRSPGLATFSLVQNTNHLFAKVPSRKKELENIDSGISGQFALSQFNEKFPHLIDSWIKTEKNKESTLTYNLVSTAFPKSLTQMSSMDVVAEDFNGDGKKDLVLATEFGPNRIFFYQKGKWTEKIRLPELKQYTAPYLGEDSEDIATADFDKDGDLDLFFVSEDTQNHELFLNNGQGEFEIASEQILKKGDANAVLVHDFNNDGWPDILIGIRGQNEVYINQNGRGFADETNTYWPKNEDYTQDLVLADIDNDNDLDIIEGIEYGGNNLYVNQNGRFVEMSDKLPLSPDIETRKIVAQDYDNDGDMDLFYCNVGWNPEKDPQNQILQNDGQGNFTNVSDILPKDQATTLDASFLDFNEDGILDFVTTNFVNDRKVKVYLGAKEDDKLVYKEGNDLLPDVQFTGGTSVIPLEVDGVQYLYFANYKSGDALLKRKS